MYIDTVTPVGHSDPFDEVPPARNIARQFLIGLAVMIGTLTLVGVLVTKVGALGFLRDWDDSISGHLAENRSDDFIDYARFMTRTGDTFNILGLMTMVTLVLAALRKWRAMLFVPLAMLAEITTFLSVNYLVGRDRPDVEKLGPLPGTYSFPSGHIAATFVCWVGIGLLIAAYGHRRLAAMVTTFGTAMGLAMGWSRVYVGMHHTVDVIAGLAMGIAALALAIWVLRVEFRDERTP